MTSTEEKRKPLGSKLLIHQKHHALLEQIAESASLPANSKGLAANMVIGRFGQEMLEMLDPRPKESKTIRFTLGRFKFHMVISTVADNPSQVTLDSLVASPVIEHAQHTNGYSREELEDYAALVASAADEEEDGLDQDFTNDLLR